MIKFLQQLLLSKDDFTITRSGTYRTKNRPINKTGAVLNLLGRILIKKWYSSSVTGIMYGNWNSYIEKYTVTLALS